MIKDIEYLVDKFRRSHFERIEDEYPDFKEKLMGNLFEGGNVGTQEIEVEFGCDLFVQFFIDVVVLIRRSQFPPFEMFVEFAVVLE